MLAGKGGEAAGVELVAKGAVAALSAGTAGIGSAGGATKEAPDFERTDSAGAALVAGGVDVDDGATEGGGGRAGKVGGIVSFSGVAGAGAGFASAGATGAGAGGLAGAMEGIFCADGTAGAVGLAGMVTWGAAGLAVLGTVFSGAFL